MSKHHRHECCCRYPSVYAMGGGTGMAGYGAVGTGYGGCGSGGIRWIYALLILIVIVLQFGRKDEHALGFKSADGCCEDGTAVSKVGGGFLGGNGLIDNSVLFIIVVFLLVICAGCWFGSGVGGGYASGGFGGYGY